MVVVIAVNMVAGMMAVRVAVVKSLTIMVVVVLEMLHHIYYSSISFTVMSSTGRKIHLSKTVRIPQHSIE